MGRTWTDKAGMRLLKHLLVSCFTILAVAAQTESTVSRRIWVEREAQAKQLLTSVKPVYPDPAKKAGVEGTVRFRVIIDTDGTVRDARVAFGHELLVAAATQAVLKWRYFRTAADGQYVEVETEVDVPFTLNAPTAGRKSSAEKRVEKGQQDPDPLFFPPGAYVLLKQGLPAGVGTPDPSVEGQLAGPEFAGRRLNFAEMSAIARSKLAEAAMKKGILEREVTRALFDGRFKPAVDDLRLAYEGLTPLPAPPFTAELAVKLKRERNELWNMRFGSISDLGDLQPVDREYAWAAVIATNAEEPERGTQRDAFFLRAASNFKDPRFCEKINPKAEGTSTFNPEGFRGEFFRSACYEKLAIVTKRLEFCAKVVPQTNFLRDGSKHSKEYCEQRVSQNTDYIFPGTLTALATDGVAMFQEAGYALADLGRFRLPAYATEHEKIYRRAVGAQNTEVTELDIFSRFYWYLVSSAPQSEREEAKRRLLALANQE